MSYKFFDDFFSTLRTTRNSTGHSYVIKTEAGSKFTIEAFKICAVSLGIAVKFAPTKVHDRIDKVERSHAMFRSVYDKLTLDLPRATKEHRLSIALRGINDAPSGPDGISPTNLVFVIYPKYLVDVHMEVWLLVRTLFENGRTWL